MRWMIPALLVLGGCSSNVAYDYDRKTDFSAHKNFSFVNTSSEDDSADADKIEQAIQQQLQEEGIRQVNNRSSDLLVRYRFDPEQELNSYGAPAAGISPGEGSTVMSMRLDPADRDLRPAELMVEILEPNSRETVWRATALMDFQNRQTDESRTQLINEVVGQMFENFPPRQ